jgi:hypothetical protein
MEGGDGKGRTNRYALDFGVWVVDREIVEEKHAVKRLGKELYLCLFINWLSPPRFELFVCTKMYPAIRMASPT